MPEQGAALELAKELIARKSVTPEDGGCQQVIAARLERAAFRCEPMLFGAVQNLWAKRGAGQPVVCFAGHTDVVPTGPLNEWHSDRSYPRFATASFTAAARPMTSRVSSSTTEPLPFSDPIARAT